MITLLTSAYNLLESLTGNYSLVWSGLNVATVAILVATVAILQPTVFISV